MCAYPKGCPRKAQVRGFCRTHYTTMRRYRGLVPLTIEERFWANVQRGPDSECWPWTGYTDTCGYGMISVKGERTKAHRLAWRLLQGPIPDGAPVLHHCDNPPCCNPACLFLGDPLTNDADKRAKGRAPRQDGEHNGKARLTWEIVDEMRARYAIGDVTQAHLAEGYGISRAMTSFILTERRWPTYSRSEQ